MILFIDAGNTRLKWAHLSSSNQIVFGGACAYRNTNFTDLLNIQLGQLVSPLHVFIANVAGESLGQILAEWINTTWKCGATFLKSQYAFGSLKNAYAHPENLGVDRWLNMLAATQLTNRAAFVVDCGSFVTIDAIDPYHHHLGGYITPGLELMYASLTDYSKSRLYVNRRDIPHLSILGKNTHDCILTGCTEMLVAFINQTAHQIETLYPENLEFVITGGDAETLLPALHQHYIHRPALVFEGMALLAQDFLSNNERNKMLVI